MAQDRVDKRWQNEGLGKYSTEAILGTLAHYGVAVDEATFRALAKDKYPLEMSLDWQEVWKGTGQFTPFPSAAATELWKRLEKDRLAPAEAAEALINLMVALSRMAEGRPDAPVAERFEAFNALKAKVPQTDGGAEERFSSEVFAHFTEDAWKVFDSLAERLAKDGQPDDARAFVAVEEFLVPERKGIATAVVDAAEGKREQALAALTGIAQDTATLPERRISALDALLALDAKDEVIAHGIPLLDDAEKRQDYHLGMGLADRLVQLLREKRELTRAREIEARLEKLVEAHHAAHPHHHH